jgi:hypothetical protein
LQMTFLVDPSPRPASSSPPQRCNQQAEPYRCHCMENCFGKLGLHLSQFNMSSACASVGAGTARTCSQSMRR